MAQFEEEKQRGMRVQNTAAYVRLRCERQFKDMQIPTRGDLPTGKDLTDKQKQEKQRKQHMFKKQPSVDQLQNRLKVGHHTYSFVLFP